MTIRSKIFLLCGLLLFAFSGCTVCKQGAKYRKLCLNTCKKEDRCGDEALTKINKLKEQLETKRERLDEVYLHLKDSRQSVALLKNDLDLLKHTIDKQKKEMTSLRVEKSKLKLSVDEKTFQLANIAETKFPVYYVVAKGDWLSKIAEKLYYDAKLWPFIWWTKENREAVYRETGEYDPDLIVPGTFLKIDRDHTTKQREAAISIHQKRYKKGAKGGSLYIKSD